MGAWNGVSVGTVAIYGAPFLLAGVLVVLRKMRLAYALLLSLTLFLGFVQIEPAPWDTAAAVWILLLVLQLPERTFRIQSQYLLLWVAFVLLHVLLGVYWMGNSTGLAVYAGITVFLGVCSLGFQVVTENVGRTLTLLRVFVVGAALSAAIGSFRFLAGDVGPDGRAWGFFKDPNVSGAFMAAALLIVVARRLMLEESRSADCAVGALLCVGILFSFSRGALINLVSGLLVIFALCRRFMRRGILVGGAIVLVMVATASVAGVADFAMQRLSSTDTTSEQFRLVALQKGWEVFVENPMGIGPGQFHQTEFVIKPRFGIKGLGTHNTLLRAATELGIVGLVLWICLTVFALRCCWRNRHHPVAEVRFLAIACTAVLVGIAAQGFVLDTLHWRHLWMFMGLAVGVDMMAARTKAAARDLTAGEDKVVRSTPGLPG